MRARRLGTRLLVVAMVAALSPFIGITSASAAPGDITTVAGGGDPKDFVGDKKAATQALLRAPWGLDEAAGDLFISENVGNRVRRVDGATKSISTVAGGGVIGLGDGGQATAGRLSIPQSVLVDPAGAIFIADTTANRIRRVAPDGTITTLAGNGVAGFGGDGQLATKAKLNAPLRLARDATGNIYVTDSGNFRIRRIDTAGRISTVAGTVPQGQKPHTSSGDGGSATAAQFTPRGIAIDGAGNLFIADLGDDIALPPVAPRIRKIVPGADGVVNGGADEIITTVAGGGTLEPGGAGEGAAATSVKLSFPEGLAFDGAGNLFITTFVDQRVLRLDKVAQTLTTVAGTGVLGSDGDGGPATSAKVANPFGVAVDSSGNVYLAQLDDSRIRKIDAGTHVITTIGGDGTPAFGGDGGPATAAQFNGPADLAIRGTTLFVADGQNNRIRTIDGAGVVHTVAGGGIGDGLPATAAILTGPRGVAVDGAGSVFVSDCGTQRVRRVANGVISTYVGGLVPFRCPSGLHLVASGPDAGTLYVADAGAHQVFRVGPGGSPVTIVAGTGAGGFSGDNGLATAAALSAPVGVSLDGAGNLLIADTGNNRIRKVAPSGVITTVAGNGTLGIGYDGVNATSVPLSEPSDVIIEASGAMVIAETGLHRLRRVSPSGIISTIAGNGIPAFAGDGGPAAAALLTRPTQLDLDAGGALLFTDQRNRRVRRIEPGSPAPPPTTGCGQVITANTTLTADLGPCSGDGIVVGADNVTLDLNGHTVFGTDGSTGASIAAGIRLYARQGVTITGGTGSQKGTVRGFDAGIAVIGGTGSTIQDIVVRDNISGTTDQAVFGDGIGLFFSAGNTIIRAEVTHNGRYDGIGVLGLGANDNVVQDSTISDTSCEGETGACGIGVLNTAFLAEDLPREISTYRNRYIGNTLSGNDNSGLSVISNVDGAVLDNVVDANGLAAGAFPGNGIGVQNLARAQAATRVAVMGNTVTGNAGDGIRITSSENEVSANEVHGNLGSGIHVEGTSTTTGHLNSIHDNDAANNSSGPLGRGDLVDFSVNQDTFLYDCDSNTWLRNTWGSGGYWPDPANLGAQGPVACTTTDGSAAASSVRQAALSPADAQALTKKAPVDDTAVRHGPPR